MTTQKIKHLSDKLYQKLNSPVSQEFRVLCKAKKYIQEEATKEFSDGDLISIQRSEVSEPVFFKLIKAGRKFYADAPSDEKIFIVSFAIATIMKEYGWCYEYYSESHMAYISKRLENPNLDLRILLESHLKVIDAYCNSARDWTYQNLPTTPGFKLDVENWRKLCHRLSIESIYKKIEDAARETVVRQYQWDEYDVDGFSWAIGTLTYVCVFGGILPSFDMAFKSIYRSYVKKGLDTIKQNVIASDSFEDSNMLFDFGYNYYYGIECAKDLHKAVIYWEKAALKGHVMAQFNLAQCYESSIGVSQDLSKSFYWYQKAAENGDMDAIYNTGCNYYMGKGCKKDYYEAVRYFEMAADKQYTKAIYNLGICYRDGTGVQADCDKAVELLQQAANQGHEKAQTALQQMLSTYYKDDSLDWEDDDLAF